MDALQIGIAVLAWFAIATTAAVAVGRAVALADLKEGSEPVVRLWSVSASADDSWSEQVRTPASSSPRLSPQHVAAARDLPR